MTCRSVFLATMLLTLAAACEEEHCHGGCGHGEAGPSTVDAGPDPAEVYCNCMLVNCHEPFHDRWGPDDPTALTNCAAEANGVPRATPGTDTGNSLECRITHCERAATSPDTECPAALGDTICT